MNHITGVILLKRSYNINIITLRILCADSIPYPSIFYEKMKVLVQFDLRDRIAATNEEHSNQSG